MEGGQGGLDLQQLLHSRSRLRLPDGRKLCYTHYGLPLNSRTRPTKVLLYFHGWPSSRLEPAVLGEEARKQGMRIIAIDRPGSGHSTFNPNGTFETLAEDVERLLDHLGLDRVVLMACSGGSPFASACATLLPERVESLLLVCPLAPMFGREAELLHGIAPVSRQLFTAFNRAPWAARLQLTVIRQAMYLPQHLPTLRYGLAGADIDAMSRMPQEAQLMRAAAREGLRQGIRGPFHDMVLYATRPWEVELETLSCPCVIWIGEDDITTPPAMARYYHGRIPGSRLQCVPGEGHFSLPFKHGAAILGSVAGSHPSRL